MYLSIHHIPYNNNIRERGWPHLVVSKVTLMNEFDGILSLNLTYIQRLKAVAWQKKPFMYDALMGFESLI